MVGSPRRPEPQRPRLPAGLGPPRSAPLPRTMSVIAAVKMRPWVFSSFSSSFSSLSLVLHHPKQQTNKQTPHPSGVNTYERKLWSTGPLMHTHQSY